MSQPQFTRIVVEVKFLRLYTCTRCGRQQQGDTERMSIDRTHVAEVVLSAAALRPIPQHMPVGWASYLDGIRCSECKS
jgi:DNA-directed RNA polymerase subunit RPC12/RpoP